VTGAPTSGRARRVVLVAVSAAALLGVGWGLGRSGAHPTPLPDPSPADSPTASDAPVRPTPTRTRAGAVEAARRVARLYASPGILDSRARRDLFARTALPEAARRFEASYRRDLPTLRRGLGLPAGGDGPTAATLVMRSVSLGYRVGAYTPDRAAVGLWTVLILGNGAAVAPQAGWRSVEVDLTWRDGGWRVADLRDRPGPTPALLGVPSPAGVFADDQAGYRPHEP